MKKKFSHVSDDEKYIMYDELDGEEYYTDENGEYYEEPSEGEYYEYELQPQEGEYYSEEMSTEQEYYEEGVDGQGEYYADEVYGDEEYLVEDAGYYAEEVSYEENNANWDSDEDVYDDKENFFLRMWKGFLDMEVMDRVIVTFGVAVVIMLVVIGSVFMTSRTHYESIDDLVAVGKQLESIDCIGEKGLVAVADATMAKIIAASMAEEEENSDYNEADYNSQVSVQMSLTSVLKDLKIKFNNKSTGKLVANVPFSVEIEFSNGKSEIWTDDDMDGIIYKKDVTTGKCIVKLQSLEDEKYEKYTLPTASQNIEVKSEIAYEKVEVSDEVKTESEINVSKEDTAVNDTVVESSLTDTVAWVESTATVNTYVQVAKTTIADPTASALSKLFMRISSVTGGDAGTGGEQGGNGTGGEQGGSGTGGEQGGNGTGGEQGGSGTGGGVSGGDANNKVVYNDLTLPADKAVTVAINKTVDAVYTATGATEGQKIVYTATSDNTSVATATTDATGKTTIKGVAAGTATITVTAEYESADSNGSKHTKTAKITVTVAGAQTITLSKTSATVYLTQPLTITATIANALDTTTALFVESSNTTVATVKAESYNATNKNYGVVITGVAEGDAVITVKYQEKDGTAITATCAVKVKTHPKDDKTTKLVDTKNQQIYVQENGTYREAVYADYYTATAFYTKGEAKYTGWQTLDGKVYFFKADGTKVTGEQVIQGAKYTFASDGSLVTGSGTMGIDVSKWNGTIDWAAVKNSGVSYVIIRCGYRGSSQGMLVADPKYKTNISGALAAGLKVGVYFFTQAIDEVEAVEEASFVIDAMKGYKISYPVFLDVESSGGRGDKIDKATRTAVCKTFCETIKRAGYTSGIYANKTWLTNKIDAGALSAYKIWLAQYAAAPTYTGRYDLWQYKSTGKVSGISGDVDLNFSYLGY